MPYVLVSLKHTKEHDLFVTLWGQNECGYVFSSEKAGVYKEIKDGHHDYEHTMPVEVGKVSKLFIEALWDGHPKKMIPNCKAVWNELGVKMTKNGLERI